MSDQGIELSRLFFLIEDWLNKDPILVQHFNVWPEIPMAARYKGHQTNTRWILHGPRNVCYITDMGVWVMDPIVSADRQVRSSWAQLNHADPKFFDHLRSYLMLFV